MAQIVTQETVQHKQRPAAGSASPFNPQDDDQGMFQLRKQMAPTFSSWDWFPYDLWNIQVMEELQTFVGSHTTDYPLRARHPRKSRKGRILPGQKLHDGVL